MCIPTHIKEIDLEGQIPAQKEMALKLLTEEADAFAKDDNDVGCILDLELDLDIEDQTPVQKNYVAVPKPLYPEVKAYIEDLLNQNFIKKSSSSYSSLVVCVRKKDQSLRLCVDFRALNKKTRPIFPFLHFPSYSLASIFKVSKGSISVNRQGRYL